MGRLATRRTVGLTTLKWSDLLVVVEHGPDQGLSARLEEGTLLVGTAEDCGLRLKDSTVSAHHCELRRVGEHVVVRDMGSTNGVMLDGVRVLEAYPRPEARLQLGETRLRLERQPERELLVSRGKAFGALYGESQAMRALFAQLDPIAQSPAPVLIEGETGVGKDLAAEAIHQASPRSDGPFVLFDCGAVAPSLVESELFGYEKGAFTGAQGTHTGLAEAASGGTLVLDEIGELPLELQPKLLRLVEKREVRRVGGSELRTVDVRIVACTHRSLVALVKEHRFREDLYYRLSTFRVRVPALRERPDDIPGLVDKLLASRGTPLTFAQLPPPTQALLRAHHWPGNVRELRNVVERLLTFPGASDVLSRELEALAPSVLPDETLLPLSQAREQVHDAFEKRYLTQLMQRAEGSISDAARLAGVARQYLQRLLRKQGMR